MITTVKFAKCHPDAKIPTKRFEDAGWDLYPIIPDEEGITIYPHETIIVKTGLKSALDPAFFMKITERSSMGVRGIGVRAGIIDSGYRGEIGVVVTNHNGFAIHLQGKNQEKSESIYTLDYAFEIPYGKAIAQALILPVPEVEIEELTEEELMKIPSERQNGGYGSTDR